MIAFLPVVRVRRPPRWFSWPTFPFSIVPALQGFVWKDKGWLKLLSCYLAESSRQMTFGTHHRLRVLAGALCRVWHLSLGWRWGVRVGVTGWCVLRLHHLGRARMLLDKAPQHSSYPRPLTEHWVQRVRKLTSIILILSLITCMRFSRSGLNVLSKLFTLTSGRTVH